MPVTADRRPDRYLIIAGALALAVLLPVSVLLSAWRGDESETWRHLVDTVLWRLLGHTAWLVIGVGIGVLLLGVSLASKCIFLLKNVDWFRGTKGRASSYGCCHSNSS